MLPFFLIALKLFINNNAIIDAAPTKEKILKDMQSLESVYNTILFEKKIFNNEKQRNAAQMEIAFYYYKGLCYSILVEYKEDFIGKETDEFREHFQQLWKDSESKDGREITSEPELMLCDFYKIFMRMNFDEMLKKSDKWNLFIRKKTRYFFWMDNQWKIKAEEFLQNLNWQSNEICSEKESKILQEYLIKNSQNNYAANFSSLKWLMGDSLDFIQNIGKKSNNEYMEMKRRIFVLTGPNGFDRLELTRMIVMKIESPIPEFANFCLKTYLSGNENEKIYYQLRMSISLLTTHFFLYRLSMNKKMHEIEEKLQKMAKKEKRISESVHESLKLKLEKFDRISEIISKHLCSVGDLNYNDEFIGKAKAFLEQSIYILLKCFEISANGEYIISDESITALSEEYLRKFYDISDNGEEKIKSEENFAAMNEENLLEKASSMELKSMEMNILPLMYFEEINKLLAGARADDEMQNILKNFGSIYRLASLIGGFDNLSKMPEMTRINIIRYLSGAGSLESTKFELRFAVSYFLHIFNLFRISGSVVDKEKLDKIYEQIVDVKLGQLIDVEHTSEEVAKLEEAICILLKFIETNDDEADSKPSVSKEKILSINYQQAMQCTTDELELEEIFERQRLMLQSHHYESLRNFLSTDDKELENVLKYKDGAIYLLGQLIHNDDFILLCNEYPEKIRDRKYFIDKLNKIRESFEIFMTTKDEHIRQLNKTKLEIYAFMRWLDITLKVLTLKFNPFGGVLLGWHILFRELLDELTVHPNHVQNIEIKCTIRGGHIAKLVKKWKKNPQITEQQIRNEYGEEDEKIEILISKYSNANEVPPLMDEFQEIIVELLLELVREDKKMSKTEKEDIEKAKGINLWQYFNDLHNHSEQIAHIYEILNGKNIRILYEKIKLKFHEDKFPESSSIAGESLNEEKIESVDSLVKMIEGEQSSSKPADGGKGNGSTKSAKKKNKKAKMNTTLSGQSQPAESSSLAKNMERLRSIQKWPLKDDEEEKEAKTLEEVIDKILFKPNFEKIGQLYTGFFHYKYLSGSILSQIDDKSNFNTEKFAKQFEERKNEYSKLAEIKAIPKEKACHFYKFLIRLKNDDILAENEKWNKYFKFRMPHFYWIDPEWEKSNAKILEKLKLEESECTKDESEYFGSIYTSPPLSQQSMYWCLKWLLNNSQSFIERIQKLEQFNFANFKQKIFALVGFDGFYYLELFGAMKLENYLGSFSFECIKRILKNERPINNELRMALNNLLNKAHSLRGKLADSKKDKFDKIYAQISKELTSIIVEEQSQKEEENILKYAVCIALKFFEINETKREFKMITLKSFDEISFDQFLQCSEEEKESSIFRQRIILAQNSYQIIENSLNKIEEMQSILQYSEGSIYKVNELIGGHKNLRKLWCSHTAVIRSETYFTDDEKMEKHLRKCYNTFIRSPSPSSRYLYRVIVNIYSFMKWIESMVNQNNSFQFLIENWRCDFRNWLDNLFVHPEQVKRIGMEVTIISSKIAAFIKNNKNEEIDPGQLYNYFDFEYEEMNSEDEVRDRMKKNLPEPMLSQDLQEIHVENLLKIAEKDRETDPNKHFWQLFEDLHNHSEQINHIYEILDKTNIRILYEKLGLKFHEDKFPESSITEKSEDQSLDSLVRMIEGEQSPKKPGKTSQKTANKKEISSQKKANKPNSSQKKIKEIKGGNIPTNVGQSDGMTKSDKERLNNDKEKSSTKSTAADDGEKIASESEGSEKNESSKVIERKGNKMEKKRRIPTASMKEQKNEQVTEIKEFPGISGSQFIGNQRHDQSFGQNNFLKRYEFKDLMKFDTLDMHYNELMKDVDNLEQRRFMDILVFSFEIGQRLKGLEIYTKISAIDENKLKEIQNEVNAIKINKFEDINELAIYLYNLLMKIEFAKMPIKKVEEKKIVENKKKIKKMRKNLHAFRFAWIIQKWKEMEIKDKKMENKDINRILNALNLEEGTKFNEQIQIWQTILGQIKLDHELYIERGIKTKEGKEIFDLAEYTQQLYFDNQNIKYEKDLTENLIKELEFVDVKDIDRGEPIKYEWMKKYMKTKERATNLIKEWHSSAQILFNGSYLLGTINSNSNLDIIVLTYNLKIDEKEAVECIIKENSFDEHKKMKRERKCENDKLFLCQLCKESNVISAVKINSSLELIEAIICEDDDYELKSFDECKFKVKMEFLFVIVPVPDKPKKPVGIEKNKTSFLLMRNENPLPDDYYLQILTRKDIKSDEINQILIELYKLPERKKNFFSLLGFRDNIRMLELMPTDGKNFRIACAALKLWAKRNNIYASKVGFFKGVNMNILMVKIYLLYPTASVSFLIEQFFATYIVWPWPMPVQLQEITKLTYDRVAENPLWYDMDPNAVMPIISPGFIESNKASDMDHNTKIIMSTFMNEGLKQIREIRTGYMESGKEWSNFLRGHDLGKKYQHYLVVSCLTKMSQGSFGDDFCAIASLKMHNFIPNVIGKILPQEIDWYHIIEAGSRKKCFINRDGYSDISNYKCDVWLVGLKPKKNEQIKWNEIINLENSMNEATKTMYEDYFEFKQKKSNNRFGKKEKESLEGNLLLITNYVNREDLRKWNIQLRGWEVTLEEN